MHMEDNGLTAKVPKTAVDLTVKAVQNIKYAKPFSISPTPLILKEKSLPRKETLNSKRELRGSCVSNYETERLVNRKGVARSTKLLGWRLETGDIIDTEVWASLGEQVRRERQGQNAWWRQPEQ